MNVVYPITKADDPELVNKLALTIIALGKNEGTAFVSYTPNAREAATKFAEDIRRRFDSVVPIALPSNPYGGWPQEPNMIFSKTMKALWRQPGQFVLWNEVDMVPTRKGWLAEIDKAHKDAERPGVFGAECPFFRTVILPDGTQDRRQDGIYHNGNAVYDQKIYLKVEVIRGMAGNGLPFDQFLRWEFQAKMGAKGTDLIAHRWRTVNYRRDGFLLTMDPDKTPVRRSVEELANIDLDKHLFVHGVKDASLYDIVIAKAQGKTEGLQYDVERAVKETTKRRKPAQKASEPEQVEA